MRHPLLVEGRPNCARQLLASTLSAPHVAETSCCDPGRHANVITPCLLTPCLNVPYKKTSTVSKKDASIQKCPQYCWEFHDNSSERSSLEPLLKKRGVPSRTGGERILETLWSLQMPWIIGLGGSQPYSRGEFQEKLSERFRGLSGIFPEFPPESPSRTGGVAYEWHQKNFRELIWAMRAKITSRMAWTYFGRIKKGTPSIEWYLGKSKCGLL